MGAERNGEERPLHGMLGEFRTALREEIVASRRQASSNAVPLVNGRRIGQIGGGFQYVFDIENILSLPGDVPGDLFVPGRASLEITVVSVEGLAITLSLPCDLGPFIPAAKLQSDLSQLMRKLIERIENLADVENAVGERIRGARLVSGEPSSEPSDFVFKGIQPNAEQRAAIASAVGRNTTFIWGPPGTGKSRTIGMIGAALFRRDRSLLLVSHTNNAVDQALLYINKFVPHDAVAAGLVLRVGDPKDQQVTGDLLLKTHVDRLSQELASRQTLLKGNLTVAAKEVREANRVIEICEWNDEAESDVCGMVDSLSLIRGLEEELHQLQEVRRQFVAEKAHWDQKALRARQARECASNANALAKLIASSQTELTQLEASLIASNRLLEQEELVLAEIKSIGGLRRRWRGLPTLQVQTTRVTFCRQQRDGAAEVWGTEDGKLKELKTQWHKFVEVVDALRWEFGESPDELLERAEQFFAQLDTTAARIGELTRNCGSLRQSLEDLLWLRLRALHEWNLAQPVRSSAEEMLDQVKEALQRAKTIASQTDLAALRAKRDEINDAIQRIEAELSSIELALKEVEKRVIANAKVVATTLTRAYLRDAIQSRRFDTVILDEASMAPIPALWVAASIATGNGIVVGDFKQLPPIVLSKHELAQKWLGRDIFKEAVLSPVPTPPPPHLLMLKRQYRMHPEISEIANTLVYDGQLITEERPGSEQELGKWYDTNWGHDAPVLLVDTESLHAWVTSVARGDRSSRLNFLSATVCVDLVQRLFKQNRAQLNPGAQKRILVVCPYRPHARLLEILLHDDALINEVNAGTAHSFQGSEADVVVLDLVNDEPHWRVGMFMADRDDEMKRLLNVALTRARRRLFIVADFAYLASMGKKAFMGKDLIPFLTSNYSRVNALDIVPTGFAARAAKAQGNILGGDVEPSAARIVVTQLHFYPILRGDLQRAKNRVVVFSAFITQDRLAQLEPALKSARERGVSIFLVTKPLSDRKQREVPQYKMLEHTLADWGVVVRHKARMHEKLVFVDDRILWSGSLNPLSFKDTQEIMERRDSKNVVADFARTLRLEELIGAYEETCPFCGSEVYASEGRDEPYYWRCGQEDCYTRSIDDPPIEGDMIVCRKCRGSVEFGEWGDDFAWRCVENRQHRQPVARAHVRMPKVRALIPKRVLAELDRRFGLDGRARKGQRADGQGHLF